MNIGWIANLNAGCASTANTAQCTYLLCHNMIRTHILHSSEHLGLLCPTYEVATGPNAMVQDVLVVKPLK
jgi:hypothetical protein